MTHVFTIAKQVGTQLYSRIAIGRHSESCIVHPHFKVVVVVDPLDAYLRLPPPFLNRFEKHRMDWGDILPPHAKGVVEKVHSHPTHSLPKQIQL
jgi:E3 ubiquitin-protein ligase RNF213